jgi:hypothetical protein
MTLQPHQEPFKQAPISTEQHLTSSPLRARCTKARVYHLGKACKRNRGDWAMRTRAPGREPTAQNVVGVSE